VGRKQVSGSFDVGRFLVFPCRKLYGVLVEAENMPGVLSELSAVPAKHNVNIIYVAFSASSSTKKAAKGLAFLDLTNSDVSPEELADEVEKIKSVKGVKIIYPATEGFIADSFSNHLSVSGDRAIIIRLQGYKGMLKDIREHFGTAGEAFLYYMGFNSGVEFGKSHREIGKRVGLTDPAKVFLLISASLFNCVGFGKIEILKLTVRPPRARIRVYNSFECELGIGKGEPFSHLIRGVISGVLTELLDAEMQATETKCIAKGDPYCEFSVKAISRGAKRSKREGF